MENLPFFPCHCEPVVLRAANQNLNDCQWQSYLNVTQTGVAPSRDSLRSQSALLNLSEKTSSTLPGVEEVLQFGKKQGKYSFRKVNIVLTVSGRMRTKIKNLFEITTIPKRFFWRRRRDLNPRYPFGVYTISNRARSASYATSPSRCYLSSPVIILQETRFVKRKFPFFGKSCPAGFRRGSEIHLSP